MKNALASQFLILAFAALAPLSAQAARTAPVFNIEDQPVTSTSEVTAEDVETAIIAAARNRGWVLKRVAPGHMLATLNVRSHQAVVDIHYDATRYSIVYKSSVNLNYENGKIHKNYNSWIQNHANDIQANLPL